MTIRDFPALLQATYAAWNRDKAPRLGAALAYYTIFSLAPLMVVVIGVASLFFGEAAARGQVVQQIQGTVGETAAKAVEEMLQNAHRGGQGGSMLATLIGLATVLLGAGALFGQLQDALNTIWGVQPRGDAGYWYLVRTRFNSFAMVLGLGFLLLVSLALSAALAAFSGWLDAHLGHAAGLAAPLNLVLSLGVFTLLFMGIYKVLPDVEIGWGDVWVGATFTSLLFALGKFALGLYLGRAGATSAYGSAGALIVLLLWVYYAAQILFFGAEFTKVFAVKCGKRIVPSPFAEPVAVKPET